MTKVHNYQIFNEMIVKNIMACQSCY